MIRNLKALGLALVAVFAFSATVASTASANNDHFTTTKPSALLTGVSHNGQLKITGTPGKSQVSFECTTSKFTATIENNATVATVDPEYTGKVNETPHGTQCTSSVGSLTIDMNGCHYKVTGETTGHDEEKVDATVWIECPESKKIQITSSLGPVISVPPQTPTTGGVTYTNLPNHTGGAAILVHATMTGTTYTCSTAFLCGLAEIATHCNDADYTGTVTFTGYEDLDGLPTPVTEGKQIPIEVSSTA